MKNPEKITNEELMELPKIQLQPTGDITCYGRYDKINKLVYLLDGNGNFTGKCVPAESLTKIPPHQDRSEEDLVLEEPTEMPPLFEKEDVIIPTEDTDPELPSDEMSDEDVLTQSPKKRKWILPAVCVAVLAIGIFAVTLGKASNIVAQKTQPKEPATTTTQPTEAELPKVEEPEPTNETTLDTEVPKEQETEPTIMVTVLSVKEPLIPGHAITANDFALEAITEIDYRLLSGMKGLYTESDLDKVTGQIITNYLPSGSYLAYEDVAEYYNPANPWNRTEDKEGLVPLKVNVNADIWTEYLWGTEASVKITTQTKVTTQTNSEDIPLESELPDGIKYSNSIVESMVVDTYDIQKGLIVDVLDSDGNSLFAQYYSLAQIPSGHLQDYLDTYNKESLESLKPVTIVLAINAQEAAIITALKADSMNVELYSAMPEVETELQSNTYSALQNIGTVLAQNWNEANSQQ